MPSLIFLDCLLRMQANFKYLENKELNQSVHKLFLPPKMTSLIAMHTKDKFRVNCHFDLI